MYLNHYQRSTRDTAVYPGQGTTLGLYYCGLGLGEAGEIQGKIKKVMRDDDGELTPERRQDLIDELGDLLWYVARTADELDVMLVDVASQNLDKLRSRAERGKLHGSGDNR